MQSNISAIVSEKPGVTGGFSYRHTYPNCPNPGLHIEGFGTLGLPLSTREAAALKDWTGSGKHSVENDMAQTTVWAIDGIKVRSFSQELGDSSRQLCQVRFRNHRWSFFLNKIITNICEALGAEYDKSKPRSELFKAFITEASSRYVGHSVRNSQEAHDIPVFPVSISCQYPWFVFQFVTQLVYAVQIKVPLCLLPSSLSSHRNFVVGRYLSNTAIVWRHMTIARVA